MQCARDGVPTAYKRYQCLPAHKVVSSGPFPAENLSLLLQQARDLPVVVVLTVLSSVGDSSCQLRAAAAENAASYSYPAHDVAPAAGVAVAQGLVHFAAAAAGSDGLSCCLGCDPSACDARYHLLACLRPTDDPDFLLLQVQLLYCCHQHQQQTAWGCC